MFLKVRSTFIVSTFILRGRYIILEVSCGVCFANCIAGAAPSGYNVHIVWQGLGLCDMC